MKVSYIALTTVGAFFVFAADAASIRNSRADAQAQITQMQYYAEQTAAQIANDPNAGLPVRVANKTLAAAIASGDFSSGITMDKLEACKNIYLNGEFEWNMPNAGPRAGTGNQCTAVVEMRYVKGGTDYVAVARANVAAGDSIKCNIDQFPEAGYLAAAETVEFPADAEPTREDVIKQMNEEQKRGAGFKIAAAAVIGGVFGNMSGKNEVGNDGVFGGGKSKLATTAIGAVGGAGIGAASAYSGKMGGDMVESAAINAMGGALIGNMMATGDSVLRIEKCTLPNKAESKCLWGVLEKNTAIDTTKQTAYFDMNNQDTLLCDTNGKNCNKTRLIGLVIKDLGYASISEAATHNFQNTRNNGETKYDYTPEGTDTQIVENTSGSWIKLESAGKPLKPVAAMLALDGIEIGKNKAAFDKNKKDDWINNIYSRNSKGEAAVLESRNDDYKINDFYPMTLDAEDGGVIAMDNRARLKGTMIGAGAGAGAGAFTAYQGATDEINERWMTEVRQYKDSMQKVYCTTGGRFLSQYNDTAVIPNL